MKLINLHDSREYLLDGRYGIGAGADYVEVVRCKDCKYWHDQEEGYVECPICEREQPLIMIIGAEGYCSYGERTEQ